MIKKADWLWDRNISEGQAQKILSDDRQPKFVELAALLLARKNTPKEIFNVYLSKVAFTRNWPRIKRKMRQDKWTEPRIVFWQAVYQKLIETLRQKGIAIREEKKWQPKDALCDEIGSQIRELRKARGLTQSDLAKKLNVSQQVVSHIESGRGNMSLLTIKEIARALGRMVKIDLIQ